MRNYICYCCTKKSHGQYLVIYLGSLVLRSVQQSSTSEALKVCFLMAAFDDFFVFSSFFVSFLFFFFSFFLFFFVVVCFCSFFFLFFFLAVQSVARGLLSVYLKILAFGGRQIAMISLVQCPGAGSMEADDRPVTTVFTVQPSLHHRHSTNRVS